MGNDVDATLTRIFRLVLGRLEREMDTYTVPQLIMAADKVTAIQLRLRALRAKEDSANVGSTVRKYSSAFASNDAGRRATASRRRQRSPDTFDLALADTDSDE